MSRWISKLGEWHPAKERTALKNTGKKAFKDPKTGEMIEPNMDFIYEGPDRGAMIDLYEQDPSGETTTLGMDFRQDPDFVEMVLSKKVFSSVEDYLKAKGFNPEKAEKDFAEKASSVNKTELPKKVKFIQNFTGGAEGVAGADYGGFGSAPLLK